jgi:hypothetical protein
MMVVSKNNFKLILSFIITVVFLSGCGSSGIVGIDINITTDQNVTDELNISIDDNKTISEQNETIVSVVALDITPPVFSSLTIHSVEENQLNAFTAIATDDTITQYSIDGIDAKNLNINASTGVITFLVNPDFESKEVYIFTLSAQDSNNNSTTQAITINIQDIDENAPVFLSENILSINENTLPALTFKVTDENLVIYSLSGSDLASFTMDSNSGIVNFLTAPDFEIQNKYNFTVVAIDTLGNSSSQDVNITIVDMDDLIPVFITPNSFTFEENSDISFTVVATDESLVTYSIEGDISQYFELNSTTGLVVSNKKFDYELQKSVSFDIYAVDIVGNSAKQTMTINFTDITESTLGIVSASFDNNRSSTTADDTLYIYFSKAIDASTIMLDTSSNYIINGVGVIGTSSTSEYNDTLFHRHKVSFNNRGSASVELIPYESNISLEHVTISDTSMLYPQTYNEVEIEKFKVLLKTGQVTQFAQYDDVNISFGFQRNYTDSGNGVIVDNSTGLVWQKDDDNILKTWDEAQQYCASLTQSGVTTWRVPTITELSQLSDKSRSNPSINISFFSSTESTYYWSNTVNASDKNSAWRLYFFFGNDGVESKLTKHLVRCVHN